MSSTCALSWASLLPTTTRTGPIAPSAWSRPFRQLASTPVRSIPARSSVAFTTCMHAGPEIDRGFAARQGAGALIEAAPTGGTPERLIAQRRRLGLTRGRGGGAMRAGHGHPQAANLTAKLAENLARGQTEFRILTLPSLRRHR